MRDVLTELDEVLKRQLQNDLEFVLNNKTLKFGRFYLFEHGFFNFVFHIKTKTKNTAIKVPLPFDYSVFDDRIEFDYRISTFTNNIPRLNQTVLKIKTKTPSKYYDNILTIRTIK